MGSANCVAVWGCGVAQFGVVVQCGMTQVACRVCSMGGVWVHAAWMQCSAGAVQRWCSAMQVQCSMGTMLHSAMVLGAMQHGANAW